MAQGPPPWDPPEVCEAGRTRGEAQRGRYEQGRQMRRCSPSRMGAVAAALAALSISVPFARGGELSHGQGSSRPLTAALGVVGTSNSAAAYAPGVVLLGFHSGVSPGQQSAIER